MTDLAALEAAFTTAVNAPSAMDRAIAVPHRQDVERIWAAILAALPPDWCGHEAEIARLTKALDGILGEAEARADERRRVAEEWEEEKRKWWTPSSREATDD